MALKIGIITFGLLNTFVQKAIKNYPPDIVFFPIRASTDEAVNAAQYLIHQKQVDAILSAGSSALVIKEKLGMTVDGIIPSTELDFMLVLAETIKYTKKLAVVTYRNALPYLSKIKGLLPVEIFEATYDEEREIDGLLDNLNSKGFTHIISSTLVYEKVLEKGLSGYCIYKEERVIEAIDLVIESTRAKKEIMINYRITQAILGLNPIVTIVIDVKGQIKMANPAAEHLLGLSNLANKSIVDLIPSISQKKLVEILKGQVEVIDIGETRATVQAITFDFDETPNIFLLTLQTMDDIRGAEARFRNKILTEGFVAHKKIDDIWGKSPSILAVKESCVLYSKRESNVLIYGESGTGKELFAQSIHNMSRRKNNPFVAINCAALSSTLLESELFGYESGAFTGANRKGKTGFFELAHGGTLFLDEIGDLPLEFQSKLLRAIEENSIIRVGGDKPINIDVRIIAATNKNLYAQVQEGKFREDLFFRLNVLLLKVPPLRNRRQDIPILAQRFFLEYGNDIPAEVIHLFITNEHILRNYWHGNVRELRNVVERFSALYQPDCNCTQLLNDIITSGNAGTSEDEDIRDVLLKYNGNKTLAAKELGISRSTLWRKLNDMDIF